MEIIITCSDVNRGSKDIYGEPIQEVVRCKDCKWYEIGQLKRDGTDDKRYKPSVCVIGAYAEPRKADWYCADGERKEDDEI